MFIRRPFRVSLLFVVLLPLASLSNAGDIARAVAAADPAKGEQLSAICQACHSITKDGATKIGPGLYNVVGRNIASANGFKYSEAMANTKGTWDLETLDQFIANPMKMVPGTLMVFPGINSTSDRAAVLAWLRLQSDKPVALPQLSSQEKSTLSAVQQEEDPDLALLPKDKGREEVFYNCSVCHSIKLVVQQGLTRSSWKETLDWMVEEQEMSALDAPTEKLVLDYLSTHFGIEKK